MPNGDPIEHAELTASVAAAVRFATVATPPGQALTTRDLMTALIACDHAGYWTRFVIDEESPSLERPDRKGRTCGGVLLTDACADALELTCSLADSYGMTPIPAGLLALSLVKDPLSDAAICFVGMSHAELLAQIQSDILGTTLDETFDSPISIVGEVEPQSSPVATKDDTGDRLPKADKYYLAVLAWTLLSLALYAGENSIPLKNITPFCPQAAGFLTEPVPCNSAAAHQFGLYALRILFGFLPIYFSSNVANKLRRRAWRELPADQHALRRQIGNLAAEMGLRSPHVVLTQYGTRIAPLKGVYVLALNFGTAASAASANLASFQTVCRHELAHMANKDFRSYQLAKSLRAGNRGVWLLAIGLAQIRLNRDHALATTWRVTLIWFIAEIASREFLRSLEFYADLRAAQYDLDVAVHLFASSHAPKRRLFALLSWHPSEQARRRVLEDPAVLKRLSLQRVGIIGFMAGVAVPSLYVLFVQLDTFGHNRTTVSVVACLAVCLPVGFALARMSWDDAYLAFREYRRPRVMARSLVLSTSMMAGLISTPLSGTAIAPYSTVYLRGLAVPILALYVGAWITFSAVVNSAYIRYRIDLRHAPASLPPPAPTSTRFVGGISMALGMSLGFQAVVIYNLASRLAVHHLDMFTAVSTLYFFSVAPITGVLIFLAWLLTFEEPKNLDDTLLRISLRDRLDTRPIRWPRSKLVNRLWQLVMIGVAILVFAFLNHGRFTSRVEFYDNSFGEGLLLTIGMCALVATILTMLLPRGVRAPAIMRGAFVAGAVSTLTLKWFLTVRVTWEQAMTIGLIQMQVAALIGIVVGWVSISMLRVIRPIGVMNGAGDT